MDYFLVLVVVLVAAWWWLRRRNAVAPASNRRRAVSPADLAGAKQVTEEDVTRFGEELQRLDAEVRMSLVDDAMRQDWQRALDSYEAADRSLQLAQHPDELRHVTSALEDGRYAVACVLARRDGRPVPARRPPCFFNPAHGPSTADVSWAPPGGQPRQVPVCAADEDRLAQGAEPDVRTVPAGVGRVPYWSAGPAYSPWAMGYFASYAGSGLLPGFLLGSLLSASWDGTPADGFDTGDSGGDGDGGGDFGGGDFGGGDFGGGDFGGF